MDRREEICASRLVAVTLLAFAVGAGATVAACRSKGEDAARAAPGGSTASPPASAGLRAEAADANASAQTTVIPRPLGSVVIEQIDSGPLASGIPVPLAKVEAATNASHRPAYDGPTGSVAGTVRMTGDPPTAVAEVRGIPSSCGDALATYGKLFREGLGRTVADVLVAATGYDGFLPAKGDVVPVSIRGCAYDKRTVAATFGQRIEVSNLDRTVSFLPTLVGANQPAAMVAVPRGDAVRLYPKEPGHYVLNDGMKHNWMFADVFVLKYPTVAVTGLDGAFRIEGLPVGKVKVSALLPSIGKTIERDVEIAVGKEVHLDLVLSFDAKKDSPKEPAPGRTVIDLR